MLNLIRTIILAAVALLACPGWTAGFLESSKPDPICQALFDAYIVRRGKIASEDILAASDLIASRGRSTGFWKQVREGLRRADRDTDERVYVHILGNMLAEDARARENTESGNAGQTQGVPFISLPKEVVPELISRAQKAEGALDAYVIALCRARDPRAEEFLLNTVEQSNIMKKNKDDLGVRHNLSIGFHAALGLAEIGNATGLEWLIAHSDDDSRTVSFAWPQRVPDYSLRSCAIAALRTLSGQPTLNTKAEFNTWWKTASNGWSPKSHVYLEDR